MAPQANLVVFVVACVSVLTVMTTYLARNHYFSSQQVIQKLSVRQKVVCDKDTSCGQNITSENATASWNTTYEPTNEPRCDGRSAKYAGSPDVVPVADVRDARFDIVVVVTDSLDRLTGNLAFLKAPLENYTKADAAANSSPVVVFCNEVPSGRVILSKISSINRDCDDVRRFADAAQQGIERAVKTGSKRPLLVRPRGGSFAMATVAAALAALEALYTPLELREAGRGPKAELLGVWCSDISMGYRGIPIIKALELGRALTRDIAGSDPERMAAPRVENFIHEIFNNTCIEVNVESDVDALNKDYPLLGAVNRAANAVTRHRGRVIYLEYNGGGNITRTLFIVGKGITYDTGGADVKTVGSMLGMSRDKSGAAAVAGFMKILSILQPQGLRVVGAMPMVRNSIGEEGYVPDEVITSRAGVRVRVTNTDAEGRMIMSDVLCRLKEMAVDSVNPHIVSVATLTYHAITTVGRSYTIVMDNGPALDLNASFDIQASGEKYGDAFEVSRIRREDYDNHKAQSEYEDIVQTSKNVNRGHQGPAAFLIMASGLDKHGKDSDHPLPYTHLDIAGSARFVPDKPKATPVIGLAAHFLLEYRG